MKYCRILLIILTVLFVLIAGSSVLATDWTRELQFKHSLFYDVKKIEVREMYSSPTPYAPYGQTRRTEFEYFINCAAEIKNPTDKPFNGEVTCEFRDKMMRPLRADVKKVKIEPNGSIRLIFRSGLKSEGHSTQYLTGEYYLDEAQQKDFLDGRQDLNLGKNQKMTGIVLASLTEVSCQFKVK